MRKIIVFTAIMIFCFTGIGFCADKVVVIPLISDEKCTGNATDADVLQDKTFSNSGGKGITGIMPNKGSLNFTPGTGDIPIDEGYYDGGGVVEGDTNLVSGNIKSGVQIFEATGTHTGIGGNIQDTSSGDAAVGDILDGKKAWVDGNEVTGNVPAGASVTGTNGQLEVTIPDGQYFGSKTITANDTNLTAENIKCSVTIFGVTGKCVYAIGDTGPAGGIVFYITPDSGGAHGLEAAPADQSANAQWGCYGTTITTANRTDVGTGAHSTLDIVEDCGTSGIAAKVAVDYELNGYNDWFLPSKNELDELYQNKNVVGGFAFDAYWSSSQFSDVYARCQFFSDGTQINTNKTSPFRVRAVRAF